MRLPKYLISLLSLHLTLSYVTSYPVVNTTTALIEGTEVKYKGKEVYQFLGIPFAKPPVGKLRFQKTVPLKEWCGKYKAVIYPPACSQYYPFDYDVVDKYPGQSEDCLFLNIWVPADASSKHPKAVMFWLFAGSYSTGSNRLPLYDGKVLAAKGDVIVVTPNYRLGIFGFLSTKSKKAPGNMGLYDVLEALKWVNKNIGAFGGDKNKITIAGNTAGSLIAALCTISPLTKGLFHRVIMESGADNSPRNRIREYNLEIGEQVATIVGCSTQSRTLRNNADEVIECFKSKTADELTYATNLATETSLGSFLPIYNDEFVPIMPSTAYENGNYQNVSVLIGDPRDEGTFTLVSRNADVFGPYGEKNPTVNKTYGTEILEEILTGNNIDPEDTSSIIDYYLSSVSDDDFKGIRYQVGRAIGDVNIFCNDYYFALEFSKRVPVYYFYYTHRTVRSKFAKWTGVTLFSEIPYVFGIPLYDPKFTKEEAKLSKKILKLWTNFVKDGVPSSKWKKFIGSESRPYVKILKVHKDVEYTPYKRFNDCNFLKPLITTYSTNQVVQYAAQ